MVVRYIRRGYARSDSSTSNLKKSNPGIVDYTKSGGTSRERREKAIFDSQQEKLASDYQEKYEEQGVSVQQAKLLASLQAKNKQDELQARIDILNENRQNQAYQRPTVATLTQEQRDYLQDRANTDGVGAVIADVTGEDFNLNYVAGPVEPIKEKPKQRLYQEDRFINEANTREGVKERLENVGNVYVELGKYPFKLAGNLLSFGIVDTEASLDITPPKNSLGGRNPAAEDFLENYAENPGAAARDIAGTAVTLKYAVVGAYKAATGKAAKDIATLSTLSKGQLFTKWASGVVQSTPAVVGFSAGTQKTAEVATKVIVTEGSVTEKQLMGDYRFQQAVDQTINQQAQQEGFFFDLSLLTGNEKQYKTLVRENLERKGFEGRDLIIATNTAVKERFSRGTGEIAGYLAANTGSEVFGRTFNPVGRTLLDKTFGATKVFASNFFRGATLIAPLGFAEGAAGSVVQQSSRSYNDDINYVQVAEIGGWGALSAGVIGGILEGAARSGRSGIGYFVEKSASVTDIYESYGDFFASGGVDAFKRVSKDAGRIVTVTSSFTNSRSKSKTTSNSYFNNNIPSSVFIEANTLTNTRENVLPFQKAINPVTASNAFDNNFSIVSNRENTLNFSYTNIPATDNTNTPEIVPDIINQYTINNNVNNRTNSYTNTNTNTNTNTFTFTNTNTFTGTNWFIPPIPTGSGGFGGFFGTKRGGRKKKVATPTTLIGQFLGTGQKTKKGRLYTGLEIRR